MSWTMKRCQHQIRRMSHTVHEISKRYLRYFPPESVAAVVGDVPLTTPRSAVLFCHTAVPIGRHQQVKEVQAVWIAQILRILWPLPVSVGGASDRSPKSFKVAQ